MDDEREKWADGVNGEESKEREGSMERKERKVKRWRATKVRRE